MQNTTGAGRPADRGAAPRGDLPRHARGTGDADMTGGV